MKIDIEGTEIEIKEFFGADLRKLPYKDAIQVIESKLNLKIDADYCYFDYFPEYDMITRAKLTIIIETK